MKRFGRFVVAGLTVLLVAGCGGGSEDANPVYSVRYAVSGTAYGSKALVTYSAGDSIQQRDLTLPGVIETFATEGDFLQVSAQNPSASGSITVRIDVGGNTKRTATSSAGYGIASTTFRCCD